MNFSRLATSVGSLLALAAVGALATFLTGCFHINVMGRDVPDSEYFAEFDTQIARERQHLEPEGHDEKGRVPSWDVYWCDVTATNTVGSQTRRHRKYVMSHRRAVGLPELTCGLDYNPGSNMPGGPPGDYRPDHYYKSGDPRIFKW